MKQKDLINSLRSTRLVPIFDPIEQNATISIIEQLIDAGSKHAEITFRSATAIETFKQARSNFPKLILGAGSILTPDQYLLARELGADFTISPGFDIELHQATCSDTVHIPGAMTASELIQINKLGLKIVKFFPAVPAGGAKTLHDLARIFSDTLFMPSGGILEKDLLEFSKISNVLSVGGSWIFRGDKIDKFSIRENFKRSVSIMNHGFE